MLLLLGLAVAADDPRVWLQGALVGGVGPAASVSGTGGAAGAIGVALGKHPDRSLALEVRSREMVASADLRVVGGVYGDLRWPAGAGPYALIGFAHHHETPMADAQDHPVATTLATWSGINHRTGFEVGAGWDLPAPYTETDLLRRLRPTFRLAAVVLPGTDGPPVYGLAELGVSVGVGRLTGP